VQLTKQTDYALRLLIYLAAVGRRVSIAEVAEAQGISRTHLMKIANLLTVRGFIAAARGRGGGISLARTAETIKLKDVIRATEPSCPLVDCLGCRLIARCRLEPILDEAMAAFWSVLGDYSLADLVDRKVGRQPRNAAAGKALPYADVNDNRAFTDVSSRERFGAA
jgi:Rrf2 family transcriptional regulator, nitric oxide-sensitive transcriptional repressor